MLVVADELFMMPDNSLEAKARISVPNTYRDSLSRCLDKTRKTEAWHQNTYCVQQHAFNNSYESAEITVYDYLVSFSHDIISFKMMDRLVEYWNSNKIEWHLDRGLKINTDGTPLPNPNARGVSSQLYQSMQKYQKQACNVETRQGVYCVSCFKPGTLTSHMASSGASA